jgi:hypothetical protein
MASAVCYAEIYTGEPSNRVKINLGETPWKFTKTDVTNAQNPAVVSDVGWKDVGIPHTWNDTDTFINQRSGGGDGSMLGGTCWYRKHFTLDSKYSGEKIFVEFEGAHFGAAVYINGNFLPGNSPENPNATHVIGFIGFVVDITQWVQFGGADNVLAVRVGKSGGFYTNPGFSGVFRFGHITDKVHVPANVYSVLNHWGTYVATLSASDATATVRMLTNVQNESAANQSVSLTTKVVDAASTVVLTLQNTQTVNAGQSYVFDQQGDIANPKLWYPNNSIYGRPNMYKVYHIVKVGAATVDVFESPLGIRTITWDSDYPYINGKKHYLWGASARYDYPALGTALPPEVEWRDAQLLAKMGGNLWRPGHSACSPGFVNACDNVGIMLIQPSGDGEGSFDAANLGNPTIKAGVKKEVWRDGIVRDRNNPSILAWEACNATIDPAFVDELRNIKNVWDSLTPRKISVRGGPEFAPGDLVGCTLTGCEVGRKSANPLMPAWGSEAWGRQSSRPAYDFEIAFLAEFLQNWRKSQQGNCFGLCQWYLAETPGEVGNFLEMQAGVETRDPRSFGSSMMDFNRIPKMLYYAYKAAWRPYSLEPVVAIAHHWNRTGTVRVNVFSNCPSVRLLINGVAQGTTKIPNPWTGAGTNNDLTETTTQLPFQCTWDVTWAAGTLRAEGLSAGGAVVCFDEKKTAGAPHCVVLTQDAPVVKPNGEVFDIRANGTDAALILATIVDSNGIWCPTATNNVTFSVAGPGNYRGGTDQWVTAGQPLGYHSPLDPELSSEGGMCKVAVRSTFTTGTVTVNATSPGLCQGSVSFTVRPVDAPVTVQKPALYNLEQRKVFAQLGIYGASVRYFISQPAGVTLEILNSNGRVTGSYSSAKQAQGWHAVPLEAIAGSAGIRSNGVYFVRFAINGVFQCVKRILVMQ